MTEPKYIAPTDDPDVKGYTCPHCRTLAQQQVRYRHNVSQTMLGPTTVRECVACNEYSLFFDEKVVYPRDNPAPPANQDLPSAAKKDYTEAALIVSDSPRGAAALLRLAMEKLCAEIGGGGKLNASIGQLRAQGVITERIQKALDVVRVVGNNAVHPGQIALEDDQETAMALFALVNLIAEYGITRPQQIEDMFSALPESAKQAIAKRDGTTS